MSDDDFTSDLLAAISNEDVEQLILTLEEGRAKAATGVAAHIGGRTALRLALVEYVRGLLLRLPARGYPPQVTADQLLAAEAAPAPPVRSRVERAKRAAAGNAGKTHGES